MDLRFGLGDVVDTMGEQAAGLFEAFRTEMGQSGVGSLFSPVEPFNRSDLLTPLVALAGVVGVVMLSGVAAGALLAMVAALVAVYFLLTRVFGYEIMLATPAEP